MVWILRYIRSNLNGTIKELVSVFNGDFPEGFSGRKISVSDVIEIVEDGKSRFYYVDVVGFREICFNPKTYL